MNRSKRFLETDPVPPRRGRLLIQLQLVQLTVRGFLLFNVLANRLLIFAHRGHVVAPGSKLLPDEVSPPTTEYPGNVDRTLAL